MTNRLDKYKILMLVTFVLLIFCNLDNWKLIVGLIFNIVYIATSMIMEKDSKIIYYLGLISLILWAILIVFGNKEDFILKFFEITQLIYATVDVTLYNS